ncbi:hypothetical protein IWW52_005435 [Coemansia sp. RSA 2704]|nr:hypothetical protein IWW52_005435 [Coemansia sp. RSA 2704]
MVTFSSLLKTSSRKSVLVTGCDLYAGYAIAKDLLQHRGKHFEHVYAAHFMDNDLVRRLVDKGAECVKLQIADGIDSIAEAYRKADVVVVVPPVSDDHWGQDSCVYVHAAAKAGVKGLALCSKINAVKMCKLPMLKPLHEMEKAFEEVKGKVEVASLMRCSLHIDVLWLFRAQIASKREICLSADAGAKFAPLVAADAARAMCHMLIDPNIPEGVYELTGPEKLDFKAVAHHAAKQIGEDISYKQINRKEMEQFLKEKIGMCDCHIAFIGDMLEALSMGLLDKHTEDLEELLGKKPMSVKKYLEKNANDFKP